MLLHLQVGICYPGFSCAGYQARPQKLILPVLRPASPVHCSLHRALLLTTAAAGAFAAEDYLVTTCGLTTEEAANAAKHIAHCKSPSKANAVISFLASPALGLSKADIARLVSQDARILNCSVEKNLQPRVDAFLSHGFTAAQVRTFINYAPSNFRRFNVDKKLGFWVSFLGSPEKFLRLAKRNYYILTSDLDRVVKVNIQLLREIGLRDGDIAQVCEASPRLLTSNPDKVRVILNRAKDLGVPHNTLRFKNAVASASCIGPENMAAKLKFIGEILGCSDSEVIKAVKMTPQLPRYSRERLHRVSEFLIKVAGVDGNDILGWPTILTYSLDRRIAPRHYVMKVLLEKGLIRKQVSLSTLIAASEKVFQSKYIIPHKDVLPDLADAYASACKGKLPT